MNSVAFVIVHYHTPQLLARLVTSIVDEMRALPNRYEIIVVDNGSTPQMQAQWRDLPIVVITTAENRGYAHGVNVGMAQANAEYLFFMNADVRLLDGCMAQLLAALQDRADIVAPHQYWDDAKTFHLPVPEMRGRLAFLIETLATRNRQWLALARQWWRRHQHRHWLATRPISSVNLGGAMIGMRRVVWEIVGGLDEQYFLYFEETDWLLRAKQKGLRSYYVRQAEIVHYYNQSILESGASHFHASAQRFAEQYYGRQFVAFVQRLASPETSIDDNLPITNHLPSIDLSPFKKPLWIELSLSARRYPATAAYITAGDEWGFPAPLWQYARAGTYCLTIIDADGHEIPRQKITITC